MLLNKRSFVRLILAFFIIFNIMLVGSRTFASEQETWSGESLHLVSAAKDANVYKFDKKTKHCVVRKNDSLMMVDEKSDEKWICILIDGDKFGYIKISNLKYDNKKRLHKKEFENRGARGLSVCFVDRSAYIFSGEKGSRKIGVIRKGISLPVLRDVENREKYGFGEKVMTFNGEGYIYADMINSIEITD